VVVSSERHQKVAQWQVFQNHAAFTKWQGLSEHEYGDYSYTALKCDSAAQLRAAKLRPHAMSTFAPNHVYISISPGCARPTSSHDDPWDL
jgi:hypothetical protein